MPHLKLEGEFAADRITEGLTSEVHRWGRSVLKIEACWLRADRLAVLVEGVVVEHSRPLHPVAIVSRQDSHTTVRLWSTAPVERTDSVRRLLGIIASQLQRLGAGPVVVTNIPRETLSGLGIRFADGEDLA